MDCATLRYSRHAFEIAKPLIWFALDRYKIGAFKRLVDALDKI